MAKFEVTIKESEIYVIDVEAANEEEAVELAYSMIETQLGKARWHQDSDSETDVYEIEE